MRRPKAWYWVGHGSLWMAAAIARLRAEGHSRAEVCRGETQLVESNRTAGGEGFICAGLIRRRIDYDNA